VDVVDTLGLDYATEDFSIANAVRAANASTKTRTTRKENRKTVEDTMEMIRAFRPPTKTSRKRGKGNKEPPLLTEAAPQLVGLPRIIASMEEVQAENRHFRKTLDQANNYVDSWRQRNGVATIVIESGPSPIKDGLIRVALKLLDVPDSQLMEEFIHVKDIIGVGEAKNKTEARKYARYDLAERLYRALKAPDAYVAGRDADRMETSFVPVKLSGPLRLKLRETSRMLTETAIFRVEATDEGGVYVRGGTDWDSNASRRYFKAISKSVLAKLPAPQREGSKLPIWKLYHQIVQTIDHHNVTVLSAATGSGKTTQLPQYILDSYLHSRQHYSRPPSVLVTQPRRIAAKTVAQRVADERNTVQSGSGDSVGYAVRFDSKNPKIGEDGQILFCTAGILLRRLQREPNLGSVTHLILDEVHERDVFTDVLLLVTKNLLKARPDLRVILMSATMDAEKFVQYFEGAGFSVGQVLDVQGTNHPVREHYLEDIVRLQGHRSMSAPTTATEQYIQKELAFAREGGEMDGIIIEEHALQAVPYEAMLGLIADIVREPAEGAILVFLPGWEEITELNRMLTNRLGSAGIELHLLHSTAPIGSADAAFRRPPPGVRKIILATNIAESSVTIPDVVYVIDSGKQKVMHYDQALRMNVLEPCWISRANLRQRLGRAGRCQPGQYYGFFSKERAKMLPEQTLPELLRLSLDEVCLNLKAMGFKESSIRLLATAIDPPERMAIRSAVERLKALGAIDQDEQLTPLGRLLANIPIHPAMGKMLITAAIFGCLDPVLTVVASLGQRVFRPARLPEEKYDLHRFYTSFAKGIASDPLITHKIYQAWMSAGRTGSGVPFNFERLISRPAIKRLDEARGQIFRELKNSFGIEAEHANFNAENDGLVRLILTSGFCSEVAVAHERKRNSFRLRRVPYVGVASTSCNHVVGPTVIRTAMESRGNDVDDRSVRRMVGELGPQFFIYEELIDVGQKLISKTTAVDPLFFLLFANNTFLRNYKMNDSTFKQLHVDGWLAYRAQPPNELGDLQMLDELRLHWNDFVQFVIYKRLRQEQLTLAEETAVEKVKELIKMFATESSTSRKLQRDDAEPTDEISRRRSEDSETDHVSTGQKQVLYV
jgi:ATP-dependent RNA helicase DHX36